VWGSRVLKIQRNTMQGMLKSVDTRIFREERLQSPDLSAKARARSDTPRASLSRPILLRSDTPRASLSTQTLVFSPTTLYH
jgi:hypothetical protein